MIQCTYQCVLGHGEGNTVHLSVCPRLEDTMHLLVCPRRIQGTYLCGPDFTGSRHFYTFKSFSGP